MAAVMIGLDPHKASNTIAVLERDETVLTKRRFDNSDDGLAEMLDTVAHWSERIWAVEGSAGMGRSVAQRLVGAGETVLDVPAKLATRVRVYSTGHGAKTDPADAVARAAIHSRHLRMVVRDDAAVAMRLLCDRRSELIASRTRSINRLHRLLRELIPGGAPRSLTAEAASALLKDLEPSGPADLIRVELAADHIGDIERLDLAIDAINARITTSVKATGTTVTTVFGVGHLNAAIILGEVKDVSRFPSRNHFASYCGTAPIAVSSGDNNRHRLSRAGNRQLNRAIHIAAIVQIRFDTPGRAYYRRKLAQGHSKREAIRCLKRRITDAIWRQLQADRSPENTRDQRWPVEKHQPSHRSPVTTRADGPPMKPRPAPV